jgi:hypothetical protein
LKCVRRFLFAVLDVLLKGTAISSHLLTEICYDESRTSWFTCF